MTYARPTFFKDSDGLVVQYAKAALLVFSGIAASATVITGAISYNSERSVSGTLHAMENLVYVIPTCPIPFNQSTSEGRRQNALNSECFQYHP